MLRIRNQQFDDADNVVPSNLKHRYVAGREWMHKKSRLGIIFGHFARVLDFTNEEGRKYLQEDILRVVIELHHSKYPMRLVAQALQVLKRTNQHLPELRDVLESVVRLADR